MPSGATASAPVCVAAIPLAAAQAPYHGGHPADSSEEAHLDSTEYTQLSGPFSRIRAWSHRHTSAARYLKGGLLLLLGAAPFLAFLLLLPSGNSSRESSSTGRAPLAFPFSPPPTASPPPPEASTVPVVAPTPDRPQCSNLKDDDRDGKRDFPADAGCSSSSDNSEAPNPSPRPTPSASQPPPPTVPATPTATATPAPPAEDRPSEDIPLPGGAPECSGSFPDPVGCDSSGTLTVRNNGARTRQNRQG